METRTIIIHGWSDSSESFVDLKKSLIKQGIGRVDTVLYADYKSQEDNLTFNDIIDGLNDEFIRQSIITPDGSAICELNVIVHSTGGLVIRHWIWRYYVSQNRIQDCPIKHIVMLAPANFGSPLAHRGKSLLGTLIKGRWKVGDLFEVGRQLLSGLELASPYQWELAHRDLFSSTCPYKSDSIHLSILVGVEDYTGLRGWVNKPGTDGTVVIAGTPLNSFKLILDCCKPLRKGMPYIPYQWEHIDNPCDFTWAVFQGLDHGSIVTEAGRGTDTAIGQFLLKALQTQTANDFQKLKKQAEEITDKTYKTNSKSPFQQFLIHAVDDQNDSIRDFTLEFYVMQKNKAIRHGIATRDIKKNEEKLSEKLQALLMAEVHTHTDDPSFRRLLVDCTKLEELHEQIQEEIGSDYVVAAKVFVPRVDAGIFYRIEDLQTIVLYDSTESESQERPEFFYPNTTTLIELRVDRYNKYVIVGPTPKEKW